MIGRIDLGFSEWGKCYLPHVGEAFYALLPTQLAYISSQGNIVIR